MAAGDEPLLEREDSSGRLDPGEERVVGRRQDRRADAERLREPSGDRRERIASAQRARADEMEAEAEPVLPAERGDRLQRVPGLARASPAAFLVVEAGERVEQRVEVRADV